MHVCLTCLSEGCQRGNENDVGMERGGDGGEGRRKLKKSHCWSFFSCSYIFFEQPEMLRKRETMKKKILQNDISSSVKAWWVDFFGGGDVMVCVWKCVGITFCMYEKPVTGWAQEEKMKKNNAMFFVGKWGGKSAKGECVAGWSW